MCLLKWICQQDIAGMTRNSLPPLRHFVTPLLKERHKRRPLRGAVVKRLRGGKSRGDHRLPEMEESRGRHSRRPVWVIVNRTKGQNNEQKQIGRIHHSNIWHKCRTSLGKISELFCFSSPKQQ